MQTTKLGEAMRFNRLFAFAIAAAIAVGNATAQGIVANASQDAGVGRAGRLVTLRLHEATLRGALDEIARQSGVTVALGEDVAAVKKTVTVSLSGVQPMDAVRAVIRNTGLAVRQVAPGKLLVMRESQGSKSMAQGVIAGRVTDSKSGRGVAGANVSLGTDNRGVVTAEDGSFRLTGVASGNHTVTVRLVGYAKQTRSVTIGEGITITADFKLEPSASVLDQVIVTGTVVATELKAVPSAITVVTAKDLEQRGITHIDQLFRGDIPGLFAQELGSGSLLDTVVMFSRGATKMISGTVGFTGNTGLLPAPQTNTIKTYIDGVEMANSAFLSQIDPKSIERIEILTGPQASTIYGSNAMNGVMQIFTKRGTSARPQLTASLLSGTIQNNYSSALTPQHDYSAQISGTEGRFSYNTGGSWQYMGPWTPSKQMKRTNEFGGGRLQTGKLSVDGSLRISKSQNKQRGLQNQILVAGRESGKYLPGLAPSGRSTPKASTADGQTLGLTMNYTPISWWSHDLTVGMDKSGTENLQFASTYGSPSDTLLSVSQGRSARISQRYVSNGQFPLASFAKVTMTLGADHWQTSGSSLGATPIVLDGSLASPIASRTKPGRNTGGFLQTQIGFRDALFLTYGLRAEWNPNFGANAQPNLAPRYGLAYTQELGLVTAKLRTSYGRSTRPPGNDQKQGAKASVFSGGLYRARFGNSDKVFANPDLGPEFQKGGEGGLEFYIGNRGSLVVTRYNQTVDGLVLSVLVDSITSLPGTESGSYDIMWDGVYYMRQSQYLNVGSLRNQGWELQGSVNTGPVTTRGTWSWNKSRVIGITSKYRARFAASNTGYLPGQTIDFAPEHTWALNVSYTHAGSRIALNVNGIGEISRLPQEYYDGIYTRFKYQLSRFEYPDRTRILASGYTFADLNASHRFGANVDGIVQIQNLTNHYQNDFGASYAVMGRQTKIGARIRY